MGRGRAYPPSRRTRRQRRLLLCDISSAVAPLTAFANVYIDFFVPEHSSEDGEGCVVRDLPVPYKAGPDKAGGGNFTLPRRASNAVEESGRWPMGLGSDGTMGQGPAAGRAE